MKIPKQRKSESINAFNKRASLIYRSNGYNIEEIANRLNISETEVYNYVVNGNSIVTEKERERMIKMRDKGYSISRISRELGRSRVCITRRLESPAKVSCKCNNKLNDDEIAMVMKMYKTGSSINAIAKELNVTHQSIRRRLINCGNYVSKKRKNITVKDRNKFVRLYKKGKTLKEIAESTGFSVSSVGRHLRDLGYHSYMD